MKSESMARAKCGFQGQGKEKSQENFNPRSDMTKFAKITCGCEANGRGGLGD